MSSDHEPANLSNWPPVAGGVAFILMIVLSAYLIGLRSSQSDQPELPAAAADTSKNYGGTCVRLYIKAPTALEAEMLIAAANQLTYPMPPHSRTVTTRVL